MITIHIHANAEARIDAFDVQMSEAEFAQLQAIATREGWTWQDTIEKALDRFFDQHWPAGVPRPSKDQAS